MQIPALIIYVTELLGVVSFAASGAMIAIRRRLDFFGVLFLAVMTSFGGGTVRDILLGHFPPRMFYNFEFLLVAVVVSTIVFIIIYIGRGREMKLGERFEFISNIIDAIGLAAFSVSGVQVAISAGYSGNAFMCVFMGMTTGVGGGILRDMMTNVTPYVLKKHIYAIVSIFGSLLFYLLVMWGANETVSTFAAMVVIVVIRILAAKYRWELPKIKYEESEDKKQ